MSQMVSAIGRLDTQLALKQFAEWTDRIAGGKIWPKPDGQLEQKSQHCTKMREYKRCPRVQTSDNLKINAKEYWH